MREIFVPLLLFVASHVAIVAIAMQMYAIGQ
jgi:hypothetical protein